jgi:hypothetical protein
MNLPLKDKLGLTSCYGAYARGRQDRRENPNATTWEGILPFSCPRDIVNSWLDGWNDESGKYIWKGVPTPWGEEGRCPYCASYPMTRSPDGILRCRTYPCRERNFESVEESTKLVWQANIWAGSGI